METIYVIVCDYYSDWDIVGYTADEMSAAKICAEHNKDLKSMSINEWHFIPSFPINEIPDIQLLYKHEVVFDKNENEWIMRDEPTRYIYEELKDEIPASKIVRWLICPDRIITATIYQKELNRKKAEKVAQDMLAQFLYEEKSF